MGRQGSVTVDISAQITGYEASLKQFQAALNKINVGSDVGKRLALVINQAESQWKALSKNMAPKASSDSQINSIIERANLLGETLQRISGYMQRIGKEDLNLDAIGGEFNDLLKQIDEVKFKLDNTLSSGLHSFIEQSKELKEIFEVLKVDPKEMSPKELFGTIEEAAQNASKDIQNLEKKLQGIQLKKEKAQQKVDLIENGTLGNETSFNTLSDQVNQYKLQAEKILELRKKLEENFKNKGVDSKELLDEFFAGLTPENIKERIDSLYTKLEKSKLYTKKADFYSEIFGSSNKRIGDLVKEINLPDVDAIAEKLRNFVQEIYEAVGSAGRKDEDKKFLDVQNFINQKDIENAVNKTIEYFRNVKQNLFKAAQSAKKSIAEFEFQEGNTVKELEGKRSEESAIQTANASLIQEIARLKADNVELQEKLDSLQQQVDSLTEGQVKNIHAEGAQGGVAAQQLQIGADVALKYSDALDQVHKREQLVGRIEGVVERWFSIYAAVRMVTNAAREVINTIKELDKTITEIAIVTNMSQDDLWGQMDTYMAMAREYASSISGVYKVSQLYYQQGLQTADVMALTEQTLKMARISGLDYATATDYKQLSYVA